MIENSTIKGYMRTINNYYKHQYLPNPWDLKSELKTVELLNHQMTFEEKPNK